MVHSVQCTLYHTNTYCTRYKVSSIHYIIHNTYCTWYIVSSVHYIIHNIYCTRYKVSSIHYIIQIHTVHGTKCLLYTISYIIHTVHGTKCLVYTTSFIIHNTYCTQFLCIDVYWDGGYGGSPPPCAQCRCTIQHTYMYNVHCTIMVHVFFQYILKTNSVPQECILKLVFCVYLLFFIQNVYLGEEVEEPVFQYVPEKCLSPAWGKVHYVTFKNCTRKNECTMPTIQIILNKIFVTYDQKKILIRKCNFLKNAFLHGGLFKIII